MSSILGGIRLSLALLLTLVFSVESTAWAVTIQRPLDQTELPLLYHAKVFKIKDSSVVILRCKKSDNNDPTPSPLSQCPIYQIVVQEKHKDKVNSEKVLGQFDKSSMADFLAHLGAAYDPSFKAGPLAIATIYGFIGGGFYGGTAGAIAGGIAGFLIDLVKFPVALLYTLGSYTHRRAQLAKFLIRLNNLQFDRPYKPTRITSRKHFMVLVNAIIEYIDHFNQK